MMVDWLRDVIFLIGLGLAAMGLALWSIPLALVVIGCVLMAISLASTMLGRRP